MPCSPVSIVMPASILVVLSAEPPEAAASLSALGAADSSPIPMGTKDGRERGKNKLGISCV